MKKQIKKEKKQIVEIHIYIHQDGSLSSGSGTSYAFQCTCGKIGTTSVPCPVHPTNPHYPTFC